MGKYKDGIITASQAAKELNMSTEDVRQSIRNNTFPINIGMAKKGSKNYSYRIYRKPLDQLKQLWGL